MHGHFSQPQWISETGTSVSRCHERTSGRQNRYIVSKLLAVHSAPTGLMSMVPLSMAPPMRPSRHPNHRDCEEGNKRDSPRSRGTDAKVDRQGIRVLFAGLEPGDRTPYHSHRFPVTVYVLEGAFTLELDEGEPVSIGRRGFRRAVRRAETAEISKWQPRRSWCCFMSATGKPDADPAE
jgi:hypothetical protein